MRSNPAMRIQVGIVPQFMFSFSASRAGVSPSCRVSPGWWFHRH
jgi:hypothetical protein